MTRSQSLKGLTVIVNSKLPDFWHIQKELKFTVIIYLQQLSRKQHIFGNRDNSLLLEINYRRR